MFASFLLSTRRKDRSFARSSPREQRSSALHLVFQICPTLISPKQKRPVETGRFCFVISVHFRCHIFQPRKLRNHENSFNLRSQVSILLILDERKQFTPRTKEILNILLLFLIRDRSCDSVKHSVYTFIFTSKRICTGNNHFFCSNL